MRKILPLSLVLLAGSTALYAQAYKVIHHFGAQAGDPLQLSNGTIAQSRGGAMFTTSPAEGVDFGSAFRIWPGGELQILSRFDGTGPTYPYGGFVLAVDGNYYGTTFRGGKAGLGTIFKMSQTGRVTVLHEFQGGPEGEYPVAAPIQSVGGDFYGTTAGRSSEENGPYGSLYRITKNGTFTLLHAFTGSDGAYPRGPLVQGADFRFYGMASGGGLYNGGTIFRVSSSGDFKVLVEFDGGNGVLPYWMYSGLILANDGNFYGVTGNGGSFEQGVLFRMTPAGTLTVLHNFTGQNDGGMPDGRLVQASDGNLYGTTIIGGKYDSGTLFRATLAGDLLPLHDFAYATGSLAYSGLVQHTNGMLYGSTNTGGKFGWGVFFSLNAGLPPFVTYLPTYGRAGALVQILGQGFTSASQVSFNGKLAASPVVVYPTYLRVIVPSGATTGPITVTTDNGTLKSNKVFVVHPN